MVEPTIILQLLIKLLKSVINDQSIFDGDRISFNYILLIGWDERLATLC